MRSEPHSKRADLLHKKSRDSESSFALIVLFFVVCGVVAAVCFLIGPGSIAWSPGSSAASIIRWGQEHPTTIVRVNPGGANVRWTPHHLRREEQDSTVSVQPQDPRGADDKVAANANEPPSQSSPPPTKVTSPSPPPPSPPPPPPPRPNTESAPQETQADDALPATASPPQSEDTESVIARGGPAAAITLPNPDGRASAPGKYHVVITSANTVNDAWQALSHYESYKTAKANYPEGPMGGYTRLLLSKQPDGMMDLVPTVLVDPLYDDVSYPDQHRPWAITQWLLRTHIEEDYILLAEGDQVFFRQVPLVASPTVVAVFPVQYMDCSASDKAPICSKPEYNPRRVELSKVPRACDSPALLHKSVLATLVPLWDKLARALHDGPDGSHVYWSQACYAFSLAVANLEEPHRFAYRPEFMIEPPYTKNFVVDPCKTFLGPIDGCQADSQQEPQKLVAPLLHFTYPQVAEQGPAWKWDKRTDTEYFPTVPIPFPENEVCDATFAVMTHLNEVGRKSAYWQEHMAPTLSPPPPIEAPPPPPLDLTRLQRNEENRKLKAEAAERSAKATAEMGAQMVPLEINPPIGPLDAVSVPDPTGKPTAPGKYHVVIDVDDHLMGRWQALVNHYAYSKAKAANPGGPMGGYTRILQAYEPDDIMHLVPTALVDPLPKELHRGYDFVQRPWAYVQWMLKFHVEEEYILVIDPDHLMLQQIPVAWASPTTISAWPYWFLDCNSKQHAPQCSKQSINPKQINTADIKGVALSPTLSHKSVFTKILPWYDRIARAMDADDEAGQAFGWAKDLYAFALGAANMDGGAPDVVYHSEAMVEPPYTSGEPAKAPPWQEVWDSCKGSKPQPECPDGISGPDTWRNVSLIHYNVASNFDAEGNLVEENSDKRVYHWDKRDYREYFPPVPIPLPFKAPQATLDFLKLINEAGESIPLWKAYVKLEDDASVTQADAGPE